MLLDLNQTPRLITDRLLLRLPQAEHLDAFARMLADPAVGAPKGYPEGAGEAQSWGGMVNILGHWVLKGFGLFAVELRANGEFVGCVGVIEPAGWPAPELTWTIARAHWGRGYASEAARAVRDWAVADGGFATLISLVPADNAASLRVAEKTGGRYERDARMFGRPVRLYRMFSR